MANKYTVMSEEAIRYMCGLIRDVVSLPSEIISNINLADNLTFSNIYIKDLVEQCLIDAKDYADLICGSLIKLTCEKTTVQPTLDNSELNIIYLFSSDGNAPFEQYLKISETELIDMGSTSISLNDYLTVTDAVSTYAKKVDLDTLTTEVTNIKSDFATHKNDADIHITSAERTKWDKTSTDLTTHTGDTDIHTSATEKASYIKKESVATTINSSSTDDTVPSAKAVYNAINTLDNNVCHVKQTLLFESGANGESDGSIIIGKEYTAKESILPHRMATVLTYWRECAFTKANWYNENWFYIDGHANDYNEEQNILFTYEIRILVKQSDTKIFKVLYSKRLAFNLNDNTFTSTDIKSGIALSKFV